MNRDRIPQVAEQITACAVKAILGDEHELADKADIHRRLEIHQGGDDEAGMCRLSRVAGSNAVGQRATLKHGNQDGRCTLGGLRTGSGRR